MTGQAGQKNDISGTGDGRRDGENMTGQTNILQAKLWELTLTVPVTLTDPRGVELFENSH